MAREVRFYARKEDEYIPLAEYDESSRIYEYMQYYLIAPGLFRIEDSVLGDMISFAFNDIELLKKKNELLKKKMDSIRSMNNRVDEKLEEMFKIRSEINGTTVEIQEYMFIVNIMRFLIQMNSIRREDENIDRVREKSYVYGEIREKNRKNQAG